MKCPICKTDDTLFAAVTLRVDAPLVRGGGINLNGITVNQTAVKEAWGANELRHPVNCLACGGEFYYDTTVPTLKKGRPPASVEQLELFAEPGEPDEVPDDATDDSED